LGAPFYIRTTSIIFNGAGDLKMVKKQVDTGV